MSATHRFAAGFGSETNRTRPSDTAAIEYPRVPEMIILLLRR